MSRQTGGRRWDIDERGHGVTDATRFLPDADALLSLMAQKDWIAEEPEAHLLPHLERAIAGSNGRWRLLGTRNDDGLLELELAWSGMPPGRRTDERDGDGIGRQLGRLKADAFALIGTIAESVSFVTQRTLPRETVFEATTGMPDGDGPFATHGHLLRLRVRLPFPNSLPSPEVLA